MLKQLVRSNDRHKMKYRTVIEDFHDKDFVFQRKNGYDVISNGRRISVKTTAQKSGFISINKNTFDQFDDIFVVQYTDDDFQILFYRPKEEIPTKRSYGGRYEVDISSLKAYQR